MDNARRVALAAAGLMVAAVLVFIFQNSGSVDVRWLGINIQAPLFVIMVVSGLAAVGIRDLVGSALRRRTKAVERRMTKEAKNQ